MLKILYFDCETTGLDPAKHEITQFAYILEVGGEPVIERSILMRPLHPETIDPEALSIQGRTREQLDQYAHPFVGYQQFVSDLAAYIDKYDKADKAMPCAFNGTFDLPFVKAWFVSCGDQYFGSWQDYKLIDPMAVGRFLHAAGMLFLSSYSLASMCAHFGVSLRSNGTAHDALDDVRALRTLYWRMASRITYEPDIR